MWYGDATPVSLQPFHPYAFQGFFRNVHIHPAAKLLADFYAVNYGLMLFNMLLIFYPFDAGRLLQIALWAKMGYARSMRLATSLGMAGAVLIGLFGLATYNSMLVLIALFGFYTCYQQAQYVRQIDDFDGAANQGEGYPTPSSQRPGFIQRWRQSRAQKAIQRRENERRATDEKVDQILDKVHREGLASLTDRERAVLQRAGQRKS
jgi:hypothetical protein